MSSGVYSALSGAVTRMNMLDTITDNMANIKTAGYKKGASAFEAAFEEARSAVQGHNFATLKSGFSDFSKGTIVASGSPLHLAIVGEGFFKVRDEAGNFFYTRQGSFSQDPQGNLVTAGNMQVVSPDGAPIAVSGTDVSISEDGTIEMAGGGEAKVPLFTFDDPARLERRGGSVFALNGAVEAPVENPRVMQGHLEESNVNMMREMGLMVETMRAFESSQKAIQAFSKLSEKAIEIGTVG